MTILDGLDMMRLFLVQGSCTASFRNLTFKRAMADEGSALLVWQQANVFMNGCIIADNYATGSNAVHVRHPGSSLTIDNCQFLRNAAAIHSGALSASMGASLYVSDSKFIENHAPGHGAMNVQSAHAEVTGCLFLRNDGGLVGALALEMSNGFVTGNTFHANSGSSGTVRLYDYTLFSRNIVSGDADGFGLETVSGTYHTCNLYYNNERGACSRPLGSGERVEDPLYCEAGGDVFLVCSGSSALAANNGCGAMGAFGLGCECGPVAIETTTWGELKSIFR
ncbi:MAG: right-handed parallel beta-helix repeat-containing protein [bacterium]|nr:right-handed parallel beta-helix repeat-containing protein [bacterium]